VSSHCYSVIDAFELKVASSETVRLFKIRNPWGYLEWQGDWADNSKKWTPTLRRQTGAVVDEDGIFFMAIEDFMQYFRSTTICKYREGFKRTVVKGKHPKHSFSLYELEVDRECELEICIY